MMYILGSREYFEEIPIKPYFLQKPNPFFDDRGMFMRLLDVNQNPFEVNQVNVSVTFGKGTTRGMHFLRGQHSEKKIVTVVHGEIQDIVVDVDSESQDFCRVYSFEMNPRSDALLIPPKFAHGFQVLSDIAIVSYSVDKPYRNEADSGISPYSPLLINEWKLPILMTSDRDKHLPDYPDSELFKKCPCC